MARPPTPIGSYGEITTRSETRHKRDGTTYTRWEARAYMRIADGSRKEVRRTGPTKTKAVNALKNRMTILANEATSGAINGDTRMSTIADLWLAEVTRVANQGGMAKSSVRMYGGYVRNWVKPAIGELLAREAEHMPSSFDRLIQRARDERSYSSAHSVRAVLSGICAYAIRNQAMRINPVKSVGRLVAGEKKEVRALTATERADVKAKLIALAERKQYDKRGRSLGGRARVWKKLPDVHDCALSTGVRIGELLALDGDDIDPVNRRVLVRYHLVRVTGEGIVREPLRKSGEPELDLRVPEWSVPTWQRLKLASGGGAIFPSNKGRWLDPSTVINRLQEAFVEIGYPGITSHVWRKTVTDVLKEAGLPTTMIADQLGNTVAVVERHYRKKFAANDVAASALEGMVGESGAAEGG
jgi:integrase